MTRAKSFALERAALSEIRRTCGILAGVTYASPWHPFTTRALVRALQARALARRWRWAAARKAAGSRRANRAAAAARREMAARAAAVMGARRRAYIAEVLARPPGDPVDGPTVVRAQIAITPERWQALDIAAARLSLDRSELLAMVLREFVGRI